MCSIYQLLLYASCFYSQQLSALQFTNSHNIPAELPATRESLKNLHFLTIGHEWDVQMYHHFCGKLSFKLHSTVWSICLQSMDANFFVTSGIFKTCKAQTIMRLWLSFGSIVEAPAKAGSSDKSTRIINNVCFLQIKPLQHALLIKNRKLCTASIDWLWMVKRLFLISYVSNLFKLLRFVPFLLFLGSARVQSGRKVSCIVIGWLSLHYVALQCAINYHFWQFRWLWSTVLSHTGLKTGRTAPLSCLTVFAERYVTSWNAFVAKCHGRHTGTYKSSHHGCTIRFLRHKIHSKLFQRALYACSPNLPVVAI